jgi:hypothetical protein
VSVHPAVQKLHDTEHQTFLKADCPICQSIIPKALIDNWNEVAPAEDVKDLDGYKRTLWCNAKDGGSNRQHFYAPQDRSHVDQDGNFIKLGYFLARTSPDGSSFILVNLAEMKSIGVKKGWE